MIPGITASQIIGAAAGVITGSVPAQAVAHIDFISGDYWANGQFWAIENLVTGGVTVGVNGVEITNSAGNKPKGGTELITALNTEILSSGGLTLYVEWDSGVFNSNGPLYLMADGIAGSAAEELMIEDIAQELDCYSQGTTDSYGALSFRSDNSPSTKVNPGINKMAIAWGASVTDSANFRYSCSLNGDGVNHGNQGKTDNALDLNTLHAITDVYLGAIEDSSWYYTDAILRQFTWFPAVDDNDISFVSDNGTLP